MSTIRRRSTSKSHSDADNLWTLHEHSRLFPPTLSPVSTEPSSPVSSPIQSPTELPAASSLSTLRGLPSSSPSFQLFAEKPPASYLPAAYRGFASAHSMDIPLSRLDVPPPSSVPPASAPTPQEDVPDTSNLRVLLLLFCVAVLAVFALYISMPPLAPEDMAKLRLPRSLLHVRELSQVVAKYKDKHFAFVLTLFSACYIFLQAFAIPGAVFLSILAGPLFGFYPGMVIVATVATTGSTICYLLSRSLGRSLVQRRFPALVASFAQKLSEHRDNLFFYMLFLRIAPVLPNWFISVSSPLVGVPLHIFMLATFLGLTPGNYVMLSTGLALNSLSTADSGPLVTWQTMLSMLLVGLVALVPVLFKKVLDKPAPTSMAQPLPVQPDQSAAHAHPSAAHAHPSLAHTGSGAAAEREEKRLLSECDSESEANAHLE